MSALHADGVLTECESSPDDLEIAALHREGHKAVQDPQ